MLIETNVKKSNGKFLRYGLWWPGSSDPLAMELHMITKGGQWQKTNGEPAGNGLYFHFRRFQEICWPGRLWKSGPFVNYWAEKCLEVYINSSYIGVMGSAASGKSDSFGCNSLTDWYAHSTHMTVLVTSTDRASLELRIWGMIKKYHKLAKSERGWIPGSLIEGKQMLITDPKSEFSEGRDFKNGMIGVACKKGNQYVGLGCFTSGTLVDTPSGQVPIERVREGDFVNCATGFGRVTATQRKLAPEIMLLKTRDGREIYCTPEHPFFTSLGWVKAVDLGPQHYILSQYEAMQIMREGIPRTVGVKVLLQGLQDGAVPEAVPGVQNVLCSNGWEESVLRKILHDEVTHGRSGLRSSDYLQEGREGIRSEGQPILQGTSRMPLGGGRGSQEKKRSSGFRYREKKLDHQKVSGSESFQRLRKWVRPHEPRDDYYGYFSRGQIQPGDSDKLENSRGMELHEARLLLARNQAGRGVGWRGSLPTSSSCAGLKKGPQDDGAWVDSVKIFQRGAGPGYCQSEGAYIVHNLEVDGHPSYSVSGLLAHNSMIGIHNKMVTLIADEANLLPRAFLDSTSNLSKCERFKLVALGNPNETTNAHGVICEPHTDLGGWEGGIDQSPGTKTWKTRFPNGICLQLPGSDSPNMKADPGMPVPFPFLVTRQQMIDDAGIWGVDDWHYAMMNDAKMPRGQGSRRVLTRQACLKFGAFNAPNWRDSRITKIAFLDAAYRGVGGDRCVFGELRFGYETEANDSNVIRVGTMLNALVDQPPIITGGRQIIALIDLVIVPVVAKSDSDNPEDQIALFCRDQLQARGIDHANFYYDAGMKTTLVSAFARHNMIYANTVDFGGVPSKDDFASNEIQITCDKYYSKKVTELWYSVRMCVESRQFRGMTEEVSTEFGQREWKLVSGNRIEVETKEEMKVKTGRSPDLADAVSLGVYGARQRGFRIQKLSNPDRLPQRDQGWKRKLKDRARAVRNSALLNHT